MKILATFPILLVCGLSQAGVIEYDAILNGPSEFPPNASPGTGFAQVFFNDLANTMEVKVDFSGLLGTTLASHIHAPTAVPGTGTAGVATTVPTFTDFPLGVTSGSYDHTFDMSLPGSYNPAFVSANGGTAFSAEAALLDVMNADRTYLNIHTTVVPGGEIRGFLVRVSNPVPEGGSTALLMVAAFLGLFGYGWRPRRTAA